MAHVLSVEAAAELDEIWYYIAKESGSTEHADRLIELITRRFYILATYPRIGREPPDLRPGLRSFSVRNYVIIYRIDDAADVLILNVFDGRQDVTAHI